jgi:hypothetical protein
MIPGVFPPPIDASQWRVELFVTQDRCHEIRVSSPLR